MTKTQIETLIKYLQCKQAIFANLVANKLSLGICSQDYLDKLTLSSYLLETFYRMVEATEDDWDTYNQLTLCDYSNIKDRFLLIIQ